MTYILTRCKFAILGLLLAISTVSASAQGYTSNDFTNEQLASIYYAYPEPTGQHYAAPKGYDAFYISHYGRHGSRWITSDDRYSRVIDVFKAHELTDLGKDVLQRLNIVWEDAQGRGGDLTPLGERQHKDIAERMFNNYPNVFKTGVDISARSSIVVRCIMSMSAFCERLKELNPSLQITKEANQRYMKYLAYTTPEAEAFASNKSDWRKDFYQYENENIHPHRLIASLFKHPEEIRQPHELMMGLYWIASDIQNTELRTSLSFYDIFEKEELFGIWKTINYRMYLCNAAAPLNKGVAPKSASSLLENILESADQAIEKGTGGATLRFGHDTYFIRLLALMQIEGCSNAETNPDRYYQAWQDFRVSPMAGNLQMIFYKNKKGNVLVKFLHNESEVKIPIKSETGFYYNWNDVKNYYRNILQ